MICNYNLILNLIIKNNNLKKKILVLKEYIKIIYILYESLANR